MVVKQYCALVLMCFVCTLLPPRVQSVSYKRVCYYTNWAQWRQGAAKYTTSDVDVFLCTHIVFAFASFDANARVYPFETNDKTAYAELVKLKRTNPDLKLLLAFGGWNFGSTMFSNMVGDSNIRGTFIKNVITFLRNHGFDGLDIDWEYPAQRGGIPQDKENLVTLCKELFKEFHTESLSSGKTTLLLTAAVPAGRSTAEVGYNVRALSQYFDFISLMTYDLHGSWESKTGFNSPLYASSRDVGAERYLNMDAAATWWHDAGMPKSKIVVGFATYGRSFTLNTGSSGVGASASTGPAGPFTKEAGYMSYYEVCTAIESGGGNVVFDEEQKVPYFVKGTMWVGFDNEKSLRIKARWLKSQGYSGVMFWALDLDDFNQMCSSSTKNYPLIRAVIDELGTSSPSTSKPTTNQQSTTRAPQTTSSETTTTRAPQTSSSETTTTVAPQTSSSETMTTLAPQTSSSETMTTLAPKSTSTETATTQVPQSTSTETVTTRVPQTTSTESTTTRVPVPQTPSSETGEKPNCRGAKGWEHISRWCVINCAAGFCPRTHCRCNGDSPDPFDNCVAAGRYAGNRAITKWCIVNCRLNFCPSSHCMCP